MDEALGIAAKGIGQNHTPVLEQTRRLTIVDARRGHQAERAVIVLVVVPVEQLAGDRKGVFVRAEPVGKLGPVLEGLKLGL